MATQTNALPLKIGTRGSPLALAQAKEVRARLQAAHDRPEAAFEIVVIKTSGDRIQDRPLSEVGGKGLFTKEIEEALLNQTIDIAVHSMKDVATVLPDGLVISTVLPREDTHDALISDHCAALDALPEGAVFGTSSLRRRAQLLALRPDLQVVEFRGNVQTRLKKLADGVAVATLLARAGLNRLGHSDLGVDVPMSVLLPAVAQGAVGIEHRADDIATRDLLAPLNDAKTATAIAAERAFLAGLDGSCRTPIAGLATLAPDGAVTFKGEVLSPDGTKRLDVSRSGLSSDAKALGADAAAELRSRGAMDLF